MEHLGGWKCGESHGWSTWRAGSEESYTDGAPGGLEMNKVTRMEHLGGWK